MAHSSKFCFTGNFPIFCDLKKKWSLHRGPQFSASFQTISKKKKKKKKKKRDHRARNRNFMRAFNGSPKKKVIAQIRLFLTKYPIFQIALWPIAKMLLWPTRGPWPSGWKPCFSLYNKSEMINLDQQKMYLNKFHKQNSSNKDIQ